VAVGKAFIAYPPSLREVREAINATVRKAKNMQPALTLQNLGSE